MAFHGRLGARALAKAIDAPSDSFGITVTMNLRQRELETWGVHVRAGAGARGHSLAAGRCAVAAADHRGACQRGPTEAAGTSNRHDRRGGRGRVPCEPPRPAPKGTPGRPRGPSAEPRVLRPKHQRPQHQRPQHRCELADRDAHAA